MQTLPDIKQTVTNTSALALNADTLGLAAFNKAKHLLLQDQLDLQSAVLVDEGTNWLHLSGNLASILNQGQIAPLSNVAVNLILITFPPAEPDDPENRYLMLQLDVSASNAITYLSNYRATAGSVSGFLDGTGSDPLMQSFAFVSGNLILSTVHSGLTLPSDLNYPASFASVLPLNTAETGLFFDLAAEFQADLVPTSIFPIPTSNTLKSRIREESGLLMLEMHTTISTGYSPNGFNFQLTDLALDLPLSNFGEAFPDIITTGNLTFVGITAEVATRLSLSDYQLSVTFRDASIAIPSLADLIGIAGLSSLEDYLPVPESSLGAFSLEYLTMRIDLASGTFSRFSFDLSTANSIPFIADLIEVQPLLSVSVAYPLDASRRQIQALLSGKWTIDEAEIDVSLSYPNYQLSAFMAPGGSINSTAFTQHLFPGLNLPDVFLQDIELTANFNSKSYEAEVVVNSDWEITLAGQPYAIRELELAVEYSENEVQLADISGKLVLAGLELEALATYEDGAWLLRAGTVPEEVISLNALINQLGSELQLTGDTLAIPTSLPDIAVRNTFLQYNTGSETFSVYSELDHSIEITENFVIESVNVALDFSSSGFSGFSVLKMNLGGVDVFVESAKLPGTGGWEFSGSTGPGQNIPIGSLLVELGSKFGNVPDVPALEGLVFKDLSIAYRTQNSAFHFSGTADFNLGNAQVEITVNIDVEPGQQATYGGHIDIEGLQFDLEYWLEGSKRGFTATYHEPGGNTIDLRNLMGFFFPDVQDLIPASLPITLNDILFAWYKDGAESRFAFALDLDANVDLGDLPLVGEEIPDELSIRVDALQLLVSSDALSKAEVTLVNTHLPASVSQFPAEGIRKGFSVSANLHLPDPQILSLPVAGDDTPPPAPDSPEESDPLNAGTLAAEDHTKWFQIRKSLGPVFFEQIGVQYKDGALWFLLNGKLQLGGFTMSLEGLGMGSPLGNFSPQFKLHGIGLAYENGPVKLSGAFLRNVGTLPNQQPFEEYAGGAIFSMEDFTLTGFGAYSVEPEPASMFIYALLDEPLGGPPFFFVTGLAAGFGYNRRIQLPSERNVKQFPLVRQAIDPPAASNLETTLSELSPFLPISPGDYFLALGVKFTSFKLIDSFALLDVSLGDKVEINLVGFSTAVVPTPEEGSSVHPIAVVEMGLRAGYLPEQGVLAVRAELTPDSYILDPKCHLRGGFAFFSWFSGEHSGDFALTLGGYHPKFRRPGHYPTAPRLGFNWMINKHLTLKGSSYYALTPNALMAGGSLEANYHDGKLKAWFNAGADFLLSWKPYHYDAKFHVEIGASYRISIDLWFKTIHKTVSASLGADLHLWGPNFAGKARVHWTIFSFTIRFGSSNSQKVKPISWSTFKSSFLPESSQITSANVAGGLLAKNEIDGKNVFAIEPKNFAITTNTLVPIISAKLAGTAMPGIDPGPGIAVGSVGLGHGEFSSSFDITITRNGIPIHADFKFSPIRKNVPAALWGNRLIPKINGDSLIRDALTGFRIEPGAGPLSNHSHDIDRNLLLYTISPLDNVYLWETITSPVFQGLLDQARENLIDAAMSDPTVTTARNSLVTALGLGFETDLTGFNTSDFFIQPQVFTIVTP